MVRQSIAIYDSQFAQEEEALLLPESPEVLRIIKEGSPAVTFLHVALSILTLVEQELGGRSDEFRFVKDCLNAGHEKTQLPCNLVSQVAQTKGEDRGSWTPQWVSQTHSSRSSARSHTMSRQGSGSDKFNGASIDEEEDSETAPKEPEPGYRCSNLRGMLRAQRGVGTNDAALGIESLPWMGPEVPRWPVPKIDSETASQLEGMLHTAFNEWDFDTFRLAKVTNGRPLQFTSWEALRRGGCFSEFPLDPDKLCQFLSEVEAQYMTEAFTAYHNTIHAADVTQSVHSMLHEFGAVTFFDPMDVMGVLIAATIHDMGHDGKNNAFHVSSQDHIALTWNDKSVLENYHVSEAFKLLVQHSNTNFLQGLAKEQLRILRKEVISMVLATDMANHFTEVGNFHKLVEKCGTDVAFWHEDEASMDVFRCMILHTSDISNPAKSFHLASQWSERCLNEFFEQGDAEKRLGLPISPMCDRVSTNVPGSQIGFIDFIVQPAFMEIAIILPQVRNVALKAIKLNRELWKRRQDELEHGMNGSLSTQTFQNTGGTGASPKDRKNLRVIL